MLLNRIDTKFVIPEDHLVKYLDEVIPEYKILVIGENVFHPYETLYFDTPGFDLYHMHHNGKNNRYKLRCRRYVNTGTSFFEVKTKTNTSRTIKSRIHIDHIPDSLSALLNQYISENTPGKFQRYIPSLRVFFDRLTLVNKKANERLTFDFNIRYVSNGLEKKIDKIVIAEVKQEKHSVSPFRELMKENHQAENYISKYCLGIASMNNGIKRNLFKQKINDLNKLGYDIH